MAGMTGVTRVKETQTLSSLSSRSSLERLRALKPARQFDVAAFHARLQAGVHGFEDVEGHLAAGAVGPALTQGGGHVGDADAAAVVGVAMGQQLLVPLLAPSFE